MTDAFSYLFAEISHFKPPEFRSGLGLFQMLHPDAHNKINAVCNRE
jgi:hypothetical protein